MAPRTISARVLASRLPNPDGRPTCTRGAPTVQQGRIHPRDALYPPPAVHRRRLVQLPLHEATDRTPSPPSTAAPNWFVRRRRDQRLRSRVTFLGDSAPIQQGRIGIGDPNQTRAYQEHGQQVVDDLGRRGPPRTDSTWSPDVMPVRRPSRRRPRTPCRPNGPPAPGPARAREPPDRRAPERRSRSPSRRAADPVRVCRTGPATAPPPAAFTTASSASSRRGVAHRATSAHRKAPTSVPDPHPEQQWPRSATVRQQDHRDGSV